MTTKFDKLLVDFLIENNIIGKNAALQSLKIEAASEKITNIEISLIPIIKDINGEV